MWFSLLDIIKFSLIGGEIPHLNKNIEWDSIYKICRFHKIEALVCYGLEKMIDDIDIPQDIYNKFKSAYRLSVARHTMQEFSKEELFRELEKEKVDYLPLKGIIMQQFYPKPELRMMADLDILFRENQELKVDIILEKLGYEFIKKSTKDKEYIRKPFMSIETHYGLVDQGSCFSEYYQNPWNKSLCLKKNSCAYHFSWEDFYIYMIVHLAKHFQMGGSGIRSVIDIWLFENKITTFNWQYVYGELEILGLAQFARNISALSRAWFEKEKYTEICGELTDFIIGSGVFGTQRNVCMLQLVNTDEKLAIRRIKVWLKRIFPSVHTLEMRYPYLKKYPYLICFAWIQRVFRIIFLNTNHGYQMVNYLQTDKAMLEKREKLFLNIGLNIK